jgi:hypothetical protein
MLVWERRGALVGPGGGERVGSDVDCGGGGVVKGAGRGRGRGDSGERKGVLDGWGIGRGLLWGFRMWD